MPGNEACAGLVPRLLVGREPGYEAIGLCILDGVKAWELGQLQTRDIMLEGLGKSSESAVTTEDYRVFTNEWLRCYENPEMSNLKDHNGRTIWFKVREYLYMYTYILCSAS